jgi:hypothetical protein
MKSLVPALGKPGPQKGGAQFLPRLKPRRAARKFWRTIYRKDFVEYRGMPLPLRDDRRVISGEAFGSDEWFLQSGIVEALRLSARMGYNSESKILDIRYFWRCRLDALVSRLVDPWKSLALLVPVGDCSRWG